MTLSELEAQVKTTRAQYDASVQLLFSRLAELPKATDRLQKLDQRLGGLQQEVNTLRTDMKDLVSKAQTARTRSADRPRAKMVMKRSVSWSAQEAETKEDSENESEGENPDLVAKPKPATSIQDARKRSSCLSSSSFADSGGSGLPGGRVVELQTKSEFLGPLECILCEPLGKQASPQEFISTGLIICLHGNPPSKTVLAEWSNVLTQVKWLDLGCSVALPNLEMTPTLTVEDLECLVDCVLNLTNLSTCILVGKAWGALRAVMVACSEKLKDQIEGVILMAPSSPAPEVCQEVPHPTLLLWGKDDDTEAFENHEEWLEALDGRSAPTTEYFAASGGHNFGRILEDPDCRAAVRNFTVAALLKSELDGVDPNSTQGLTERARRLTSELPNFLLAQSGQETEAVKRHSLTDASGGQRGNTGRSSKRLSALLPQWMASGMPTSSE